MQEAKTLSNDHIFFDNFPSTMEQESLNRPI